MNLSKINQACVRIHKELKLKYVIVPTVSQLRMACIYNSSKYNGNWNLDITSEFASFNTECNSLMNDVCDKVGRLQNDSLYHAKRVGF